MVSRQVLVFLIQMSIMFGSCVNVLSQIPQPHGASESLEDSDELRTHALSLVDQTITEVSAFKLPENRVLVYTAVGDLLWESDEPRARGLYLAAVNELLTIETVTLEKSTTAGKIGPQPSISEIGDVRRFMLLTLAERDARFALELLYTSRRKELLDFHASYAPSPTTPKSLGSDTFKTSFPRSSLTSELQREIDLEQKLVNKVVDQDPDRILLLIRESMKLGFSYDLLSLVQKVRLRNPALGEELLIAVVQKLTDFDYKSFGPELNTALAFLRTFGAASRPRSSRGSIDFKSIQEKDLKALASKLAETVMKLEKGGGLYQSQALHNAMPVFQQLVPETLSQLQKKLTSLSSRGGEIGSNEISRSLFDPEVTISQLISDATKVRAGIRGPFYQRAITISVNKGQEAELRELLKAQPESVDRENAIGTLDSKVADNLIRDRKYESLAKVIEQTPNRSDKIRQTVRLAVALYQENTTERKDEGVRLMLNARQLVNDIPESKDEIEAFITVTGGYATVDPRTAFIMVPVVIEMANDLIDASAILAKYNSDSSLFRGGELLLINVMNNRSVFARHGDEIRNLSRSDFNRTLGLASQFRRTEVRVFANVILAQSVLGKKGGGIPLQ